MDMTGSGLTVEHGYFLLELLLAAADICFLIRFYNAVIGTARIGRRMLYSMAVLLILAVTCVLRLILSPVRPASVEPVTVLCSVLFLHLYKADRRRKILFGTIVFVLAGFWMIVTDLITSPLEHKNIWLILFATHAGFWPILECVRKTGTWTGEELPRSLWGLLMAGAAASVTALCIMEYNIFFSEDPYSYRNEIPVMAVFLFLNILLFLLFDRFVLLVRERKDKRMLEQQMELQDRHYRELEAVYGQVRAIRHDMDNHLRTAAALAAGSGDREELVEYLDTAAKALAGTERVISTGNPPLDTILNIKLDELAARHVKIQREIHIPGNLGLSFSQSVILFGNLLDNAREECERLEESERTVKLSIRYVNAALLIEVENPVNAQAVSGRLPTWKRDHTFHGIGLENVRRTVEPMGTMEVSRGDGRFTVKLILYDL